VSVDVWHEFARSSAWKVCSAECEAGWLQFFRGLGARGLSGVSLVGSDAHTGLVAALGAILPGAACQRCRTHYAAKLLSAPPGLHVP
jgi:putative transposase